MYVSYYMYMKIHLTTYSAGPPGVHEQKDPTFGTPRPNIKVVSELTFCRILMFTLPQIYMEVERGSL